MATEPSDDRGPGNANIVYIGAVNGGIWKTTNALGANPTWTPQTDQASSLSVSSLDLDPTDPTHRTLVAGIGDYSSYSGLGGPLTGVLMTKDGGDNWQPAGDLSPGQPQSVRAVAVRGRVIVAAADSPGGLFLSQDDGVSFSPVAIGGKAVGPTYDLVGDPRDPQRLYAATGDGVIESFDGGRTWSVAGIVGRTAAFASPPSSTPINGVIPPVVVDVVDALGGIDTKSNAMVTLSLSANPGRGTLGGTTTVQAVDGVATFNDLTINKVGTGYTLIAITDDPSVAFATSDTFNIAAKAGPATGLLFSSQPTDTQSGQPLGQVTVRIVDQFGVVVNSKARVTISTPWEDYAPVGTPTVNARNGVAVFDDLALSATGAYSLIASSSGLESAQTSEFNISDPEPAPKPTPRIYPLTRLKLAVSAAPDSRSGADPVYVGVIIGGQLGSVFRSDDYGQTWGSLGVPTVTSGNQTSGLIAAQGETNFSIAADPTNPNIVYVGGDTHPDVPTPFGANYYSGRLFEGVASPSGGAQWAPIVNDFAGPTLKPVPVDVQDVTITPGSPIVITEPAHGLRTGQAVVVTGLSSGPIIAKITRINKDKFSLNGTADRGGTYFRGTAYYQVIQDEGTAPHADSRSMTFNANGDLIEVDDGGIYLRSTPSDPAGTWKSLDGDLQVTELHSIAYDSVSKTFLGGAQDNGVLIQTAPDSQSWAEPPGPHTGDGGKVTVASDGTRYFGSYELSLYSRQSAGSSNLVSLPLKVIGSNSNPNKLMTIYNYEQKLGLQIPFYPPILADAADPQRLLIGTTILYESKDQGNTVTPLFTLDDGEFTALAYGENNQDGTPNPGVLYAGTSSATTPLVSRTGSGDVRAVASYKRAGGGPVNGVVIDPNNALSVYVVDTEKQVWHTTDGGASWTNITGNLSLEGPLYAVAYDPVHLVNGVSIPGVLVVGTQSGVFDSLSTSEQNWSPLVDPTTATTNLPRTPIVNLQYNVTGDLLIASAFGRGVWEIPRFSANFAPAARPAARQLNDPSPDPAGPPTITQLDDQMLDSASPSNSLTVPFEVADPSVSPDLLTVVATSTDPSLVSNTSLTANGADRTITFTPTPGAVGTTTITLLVSDGTMDSFTTFDLDVFPSGGNLAVGPIPLQVLDQDTPSDPIPFAIATGQPAANVKIVGVTSSNPFLIPSDLTQNILIADAGTAANSVDKTLTLVPTHGHYGTARIALTITDGVATTTASFDVRVNPGDVGTQVGPIGDLSVVGDGSVYQVPIRITGIPDPIEGLSVNATSSDEGVLSDDNLDVHRTSNGNFFLNIYTQPGDTGTTTIVLNAGDVEFPEGSRSFNLTLVPAAAVLVPTSTVIDAPSGPSTRGQAVILSATVATTTETGSGDTLAPTGTVTFTIDGVAQPPVPLQDVNGQALATLATAALGVGTHQVTAHYGGDDRSEPSDAAPITVTVNPGSADLMVTAAPAPFAVAGQPLTYVLSVVNAGPDTAVAAVLRDILPYGVTFLDASVSGKGAVPTVAGTQVTADLGDLAAGARSVVTIRVQVTPTAPFPLLNTATTASLTLDPDPDNNVTTVDTLPLNPPTDGGGGGGGATPLTLTGALSPFSDNGPSSTDGVTNVSRPTFTGTTLPGATVRVFVQATGGAPQAAGQAIADPAGNWSATLGPLADGTYSVTTTAVDATGRTVNAAPTPADRPLVIDTAGPRIVGIRLAPAKGQVVLTIEDDRSGVDPASVAGTAGYALIGPLRRSPTPHRVTGVTMSAGELAVSFDGNRRLRQGTYILILSPGGLRDQAGNALSGVFTRTFSTVGSPPSGAIAVLLTFDGRHIGGPRSLAGGTPTRASTKAHRPAPGPKPAAYRGPSVKP